MDDTKELQEVAMQVILFAGDARTLADQAFSAAQDGDFDSADAGIAAALDKINGAHNAHTDIIRREAEGHQFPYSILFSHAQDTMMTIDSEIRMTTKLIEMMRKNGGAAS